MDSYNKDYDGNAGQLGFRSGDLIKGIRIHSSDNNDGSNNYICTAAANTNDMKQLTESLLHKNDPISILVRRTWQDADENGKKDSGISSTFVECDSQSIYVVKNSESVFSTGKYWCFDNPQP